MLGHSLKCCSRQFGSNAYDLANHNWALKPALGSQWRRYSKDKGDCCKDNSQEGRTIEPWPKNDQPPPPWRCQCPREPMPYNNDPYRIKVPEIAVPKLPQSDAKEENSTKELFANVCLSADQDWIKDVMNTSNIIHQDYYDNRPKSNPDSVVVIPKLGYHGRSKYKYAFHEPWKPLDRLSLMEQAEKDEKEHRKELAAVEKINKECY